jgi:hypothetical protein
MLAIGHPHPDPSCGPPVLLTMGPRMGHGLPFERIMDLAFWYTELDVLR